MQSYTQPLLDAVFTTEYILKDGVPVCQTLQQPFTDSVEELPASPARLASTPPRALPAAPTHIGLSLKQKFRTLALALAAHLRRTLADPPTHFSFRCIRDARGRCCLSSWCVLDVAASPSGTTRYPIQAVASVPTPPKPQSNPLRPLSAAARHPRVRQSPDPCSHSGEYWDAEGRPACSTSAITPLERLNRSSPRQGPPERPATACMAARPRAGSLHFEVSRARPQSAQPMATARFRSDACSSFGGSLGGGLSEAEGYGVAQKRLPSSSSGCGSGRALDGASLKAAVDRQGLPRLVQALAAELEILRGELVFQHEQLEAHSRRANQAEQQRQVRCRQVSALATGLYVVGSAL